MELHTVPTPTPTPPLDLAALGLALAHEAHALKRRSEALRLAAELLLTASDDLAEHAARVAAVVGGMEHSPLG